MIVSELIKKLKKMPQDLDVFFEYHDTDEGLCARQVDNIVTENNQVTLSE